MNPAEAPAIQGYALGELLGRGGMGVVWGGRHLASGKEVAVKVLPEDRTDAADRLRFEREAAAMRAAKSEFLCEAFDFGVLDSGELFLAMPRLFGDDLGARLKRGPLPTDMAVRVGREVALGLAALHQVGLVHRDIKPSNIFLDGPAESARILDFGVASFAQGASGARLTRTGDILGTPAYMAPEQARGAPPEPRSDLYSLGAVLFHALTGAAPYGGENAVVILLRMLSEPAPSLAAARPDLPSSLLHVVDQLLQADVTRRPPSATEVAQQLATIAEELVLGEADAPTLAPGHLTSAQLRPAPRRVETLAEEQRLVTLVVVEGPVDRPAVHAVIRRHGGLPFPGDTRDFGLFGAAGSEGDELSRARAAAAELGWLAARVEVGHGRVQGLDGRVAGNLNVIADALVTGSSPFRGLSLEVAPATLATGADPADSRTAAGGALPLVGRDSELAELLLLFERVVDEGESVGVLLSGAAGVGKTRLVSGLVERLRATEPDLLVLVGRGESGARFASWRALGLALRELVAPNEGTVGPLSMPPRSLTPLSLSPASLTRLPLTRRPLTLSGLPEETAAFLHAALGQPVASPGPRYAEALREPKLMHDQILAALGEVVDAAARRSPVVLVVEDVHWADTPSLEAVDALLRRTSVPVLLLLTGRPQAVDQRPELFRAPSLEIRRLRELGSRPSERLVDAAFAARGQAVEPALRQALVEHAGGNPFFLAALCEHVAIAIAQGHPPAELNSLVLPVSVEAAVQARLDQLDPEDRQLLRRASVFGPRFPGDALAPMGTLDPAAGLERLERAGLLARAARRELQANGSLSDWAFKQRVVREVAYGTLTDEQRAHLHGLAGEWLAGRDGAPPEEVAHHLGEAGDTRAGPYWELASRAALQSGDLAAARDRLGLALELAADDAGRARLLLQRLPVVYDLRDLALVSATLEALDRLTAVLDPGALGRVRYFRGRRLTMEGAPQAAELALQEAESLLLAAGDVDYLTRTRAARALTALYLGSGEAVSLARRATDSSGQAPPAAQQAALHALYHTLIGAGELAEALDTAKACEALARAAGDEQRRLSALGDLAYVAGRLGLHEEARSALSSVVVEARKKGNRVALGYAQHNLGLCLLLMGDPDQALAVEREAVELARETGEPRLSRYAHLYLARIHLARGEMDEARAHAESLLDAKYDDARGDAQVILGGVLLGTRRPAEALELLRSVAEGLAQRRSELEAERDVLEVDALIALGDAEGAEALAAAAQLRLADRAARAAPEGPLRAAYLGATPAHRRLSAAS